MSSSSVALEHAPALALELLELDEQARSYAQKAKAENTVRAYRADWRLFEAWCAARDVGSLPATPATVARYVTTLASDGKKPSTIGRKLVSISRAHQLAGHHSPTSSAELREVMKGLRRTLGTAPKQKAPVSVAALRAMSAATPARLLGLRDRALLLIGFAGAFRRAELVALDVEDIRETGDGLEVVIRRSKTDQEATGRKIGIPYGSNPLTCPVRAYRAWLSAAAIAAGPVFRRITRTGHRGGRVLGARLSSKSVAIIVKRYAAAANMNAAELGGHSLRAGLLTAAAKAGKDRRVLKRQSGHRADAILDGYIRDRELFSDNAASGIGL
ncbi:MAG: tyrosine-type recombinase/integrase [Deltaproteobacteria bacterium]|nr:tyrosine-type recombinase/integrase [Deltaproteobacteria bacterium]